MTTQSPKLLFIINPASGDDRTDWRKEIESYFEGRAVAFELYDLPKENGIITIKALIEEKKPDKVIAVGGDGTVKLLAECLYNTSTVLGILPAGSANGMAKELNISNDPQTALSIILEGAVRKIHLLKINGELCIHLSDIGFNAYVVKKFQDENKKGMWGYIKSAWKVLWQHSKMIVELKMDDKYVSNEAAMVVIANASRYGNGVVINPKGSLFDNLFEVVIIKRISFVEIFKMRFTQKNFNPQKTSLYQTGWIRIESNTKVHFQIDGEYRGRINKLSAEIIPEALHILMPFEK